jgi:hypothetical protein
MLEYDVAFHSRGGSPHYLGRFPLAFQFRPRPPSSCTRLPHPAHLALHLPPWLVHALRPVGVDAADDQLHDLGVSVKKETQFNPSYDPLPWDALHTECRQRVDQHIQGHLVGGAQVKPAVRGQSRVGAVKHHPRLRTSSASSCP